MSIAIGTTVLDSSLYISELKHKRKDSVLLDLVAKAAEAGVVRDAELLRDALQARERLGSTAIGKGVAVPHARSIAVVEPRLIVARSSRGVPWDASDDLPVHLILMALSPAEHGEEAHFELVARAAHFARLQRNRQKLLEAGSFADVAALLREAAS